MLWMKACLTRELLGSSGICGRATPARSEDRRSTKLRELSHEEALMAVERVVGLADRVARAVAAHRAEALATLADLR